MYGKMILPTDGSDLSYIGVKEGLEVASKLGIPAVAIYVLEPARYTPGLMEYGLADAAVSAQEMLMESFQEKGKQIMEHIKKMADAKGVKLDTRIVEGIPYKEIAELAEDNDIIYISSHGHTGWSSLFIGSTTDRVLKHTKTTVAVVHSKNFE